jgi:serine/threonine protein kinase
VPRIVPLPSRKEIARIRDEVRGLLEADRAAGDMKSPDHYVGLFPGFETVVRDVWEAADSFRTRLHGAPPPERTPRPEVERVGPYRVLREIARGGMGVVFLAEDTRTGRRAALKVLARGHAAFPNLAMRFRREAEVASRLDHPGICTVYEAGEADGVAYIAMRYLEGETLAERIAKSRRDAAAGGRSARCVTGLPEPGGRDGPPPDPSEQAAILRVVVLMEKVALALHAAHEAGVVHRDVKPGNVMVTRDGEPVLLDFGLVRDSTADGESLTATGALLGTPAYMSPEQVSGQKVVLDRRSDVYGLGAMLYECLTLSLPFEAPTAAALYRKILSTDPDSPRELNPALTEDLRVVVETAMAKDRGRRYQTARDMAEDLRRVRANEPIKARRAGPVERSLRWVQRNPAPSLAVLGVVAALGAGRIVTGILLRDAQEALSVATADRDERIVALAAAEADVKEGERLLLDLFERDRVLRDSLAAEKAAGREEGPLRARLAEVEGALGRALAAQFLRQRARRDDRGAEATAKALLAIEGAGGDVPGLRASAVEFLAARDRERAKEGGGAR